jgi:hypothetical protein
LQFDNYQKKNRKKSAPLEGQAICYPYHHLVVIHTLVLVFCCVQFTNIIMSDGSPPWHDPIRTVPARPPSLLFTPLRATTNPFVLLANDKTLIAGPTTLFNNEDAAGEEVGAAHL